MEINNNVEKESFRELSPVEKNSNLRKFYQQISQMSFPNLMRRYFEDMSSEDLIIFEKKVQKEIDERKSNEFVKKIISKLVMFLEPANIPDSMKKILENDLAINLIRGGSLGEEDRFPAWIGQEGKMGIYDPDKNNVKGIVRRTYDNYFEELQRAKKLKDLPLGSMVWADKIVDGKMLSDLRGEFKTRYGEHI